MNERRLFNTHLRYEKAMQKIIAEEAYPLGIRPLYGTNPKNPEHIVLEVYTWIDSFNIPEDFWSKVCDKMNKQASESC